MIETRLRADVSQRIAQVDVESTVIDEGDFVCSKYDQFPVASLEWFGYYDANLSIRPAHLLETPRALRERLTDGFLPVMRDTLLLTYCDQSDVEPIQGPAVWEMSLRRRVTRLLALIGALVLGYAAFVGSAAAKPVPGAAVERNRTATADSAPTGEQHAVSDLRMNVDRSKQGARLRSQKRMATRFVARPYNPDCDDETTEDVADDEFVDELDDDDEIEAPVILWVQDLFGFPTLLDAEFAPAWIAEAACSPFPICQRLRC